jgi:Acetyltransferases
MKENIDYKIVSANPEIINEFTNMFPYLMKKGNPIGALIAVNTDNEIIGRIIYEMKSAPAPLEGFDWFIHNLRVIPELRRCGIGSALIKNLIRLAEESGVGNFVGSCTNTPAHKFWDKHEFCFLTYNKRIDNIDNPEEHGNFPHLFFYRIKRSACNKTDEKYAITQVTQNEFDTLFKKHIIVEKYEYFHNKKDDFICLSIDEPLNYVFAYEYDMGTPLVGKQLIILHSVNPLSESSVKNIIMFAKEKGYKQLSCGNLDDESVKFWRENNFNICVRYISYLENGNHPVSAAIRL